VRGSPVCLSLAFVLFLMLTACDRFPDALTLTVPVTEVQCGKGVNERHLCDGTYTLSSDLEFSLYPSTHLRTLRIVRNDGSLFVSLVELTKCVVADKRNWRCTDGKEGSGVWTAYEMTDGEYTRRAFSEEEVRLGVVTSPSHRGLRGWWDGDEELRWLNLRCRLGLETYPNFLKASS
jgi:hypothetical protein